VVNDSANGTKLERRRVRERNYRAADPEKYRERSRKRYADNPGHKHALNRKYLTKKRDLIRQPTRPEPKMCENCGRSQKGRGGLCLDHDHVTGKFRGWLCRPCNLAIGNLGDNREGLLRALGYLRRAENQ
jgi:hypothetical protein